MVRAAAIAAACLVAWPAGAQTTTCQNTIYGMPQLGVTCETKGGSSGSEWTWQNVPPRKCNRMEVLAASASGYCEAREVAANRKAVGDLIAAGDCAGALKAALGTGDLAFASEVRAFCTSNPH